MPVCTKCGKEYSVLTHVMGTTLCRDCCPPNPMTAPVKEENIHCSVCGMTTLFRSMPKEAVAAEQRKGCLLTLLCAVVIFAIGFGAMYVIKTMGLDIEKRLPYIQNIWTIAILILAPILLGRSWKAGRVMICTQCGTEARK
jgi:hypothetical protein